MVAMALHQAFKKAQLGKSDIIGLVSNIILNFPIVLVGYKN